MNLPERRQYILSELDILAPQLKTRADRSGLVAQMRYLEGQLDLIDQLLTEQIDEPGFVRLDKAIRAEAARKT